MSEVLIFKTSAAAVAERRRLLRDLRIGLALTLILLCVAFDKAPVLLQIVAWVLTALTIWGLWKLDGEGLVAPFAGREIRVQDNVLEIVQGRFTRLLFFEQLEQLRMIQSKDEKVLALELQTLGGAVLLRGYDTMEALFGALSARKPKRVILEVEESRFDRTSITFWHNAIFIFGALVLVLVWFSGPSDQALKELTGLLVIAVGLFVAALRPFSQRRGKKAATVEIGMGVVLILFGIIFSI